jgi:hypothetical protein
MKKIGKLFLNLIWFAFLTLLTQVGGWVWLLALGITRWLRGKVKVRFLNVLIFTLLYVLTTLFVVPPIARKFGRVPLPVFSNPYLKPENMLFALFNRHYVHPELRRSLEEVALQMQARYPGATVWYMDANFPFLDGYPLEPHFSHKDGKKVDIAFYWKKRTSGEIVPGTPSPIGYGACAEPVPGEYDYAADCESKGYWYISLDKTFAEVFFNKNQYAFDVEMTSELARLLAENQGIGKILIQTHLEKRLGLERYNKFRQQGCKAARHDDHFHAQL